MGMVPAGRSQHGAARAMGSRKALLQRAETKGIRRQRFPHPKIKLYEHPKLFGSTLELLQAKSKLSKEPSRHADEGSVKHEVPAVSSACLSACQSSREGKQSSLGLSWSLGTTGKEHDPDPGLPAPSHITRLQPCTAS